MPGVSPGISTPADIPLPWLASDDAAFLSAVFNGGSGYLTWEAGTLSRYYGNIYNQVQTDLRASDIQ